MDNSIPYSLQYYVASGVRSQGAVLSGRGAVRARCGQGAVLSGRGAVRAARRKKFFLRAFSDFSKNFSAFKTSVFACFANHYARVRFHYL